MLNKFRNGIINKFIRSYHPMIVEHFNNPKNVGKFDKEDPNVGTGLVGAPACFHGDTKVITESGLKTLKEIYEVDNILTVLSFNLESKEYEFRNAKAIKLEAKEMNKLTFNKGTYDEGEIICTPDHKFLLRDTLMYIPNEDIIEDMSIVPCKRRVKEDYSVSFCNGFKKYGHNITSRETMGVFNSYTLQVEHNNNYIVIINEKDEMQRGIVVKNCGDVVKLQIKVDENDTIIDTRIKVFGCGSAVANTSYTSELIKNMSLDEALKVDSKDIAKATGSKEIKLHCSMLAEEAIQAAVADIKQKKKCSKHTKKETILPDTPVGC